MQTMITLDREEVRGARNIARRAGLPAASREADDQLLIQCGCALAVSIWAVASRVVHLSLPNGIVAINNAVSVTLEIDALMSASLDKIQQEYAIQSQAEAIRWAIRILYSSAINISQQSWDT